MQFYKIDFIRLLWKYRLIPLLLIGCPWIWYEIDKSQKRNAELKATLEKQIAAEAEKKRRESKSY